MIIRKNGGAVGGDSIHPVTPTHAITVTPPQQRVAKVHCEQRRRRRKRQWPYCLLIVNILQTILVTVSVSGKNYFSSVVTQNCADLRKIGIFTSHLFNTL